ncbi:lipopolysaccharide heptosyltransferase I [Polaromonas eurypsychrophila]|uniref:Lipopolysaccharide heptosyltransferase 1 n=1 Tax=Polaromonas eurypsychrophila TaxID=1614635 RepID=A0A916SIB2_9BURK|nr:lipopolysaccharide heptosyltransferase I [Polaromonas eurypsychrophila]GGA97653.1 LPS heptosyltransferase-1 [Polaromonas eurypsychrophila]
MKVLIVKLSSLGDVVHTLPVVQDILAAHPGAQIDWVVEKAFAPLLTPLLCAGLQRVISCELRRWRKAPFSAATRSAWRAFRRELQNQHYDAVIDLQGLTKSALIAWLTRLTPSGRRYAMANQTEGSGYEAPTRWVADVAIAMAPHSHAVVRGRELAARALGYTPAVRPDYGLNRSPAHAEREHFAPESIAFVHGSSRADKLWPLDHWVALGQQLNAQGYLIVLPHGSDDELASSQAIAEGLNTSEEKALVNAVVLPRLALDQLTQQLAQCAGVIGVDSGLSHIAVALDLPHVQIYNFDTAWRTGPLPDSTGEKGARQLSVFAQPSPSVSQVWTAWLTCQPAPAHGLGETT